MDGSALTTLLRMQAGYNDQDMQGVDKLAQTLGGLIQGSGQRDFRRAAINYFKDGDISPERIQQFSSMYPGVDPAEVFMVAGGVAKQREAQDMKDAGRTMISLFESAPLEELSDPQKLMKRVKALGLKPGVEEKMAQHFPKLIEMSQGIFKHRREMEMGPQVGAHGNYKTDPITGQLMRNDKGDPEIVGAPVTKEDPTEWMTSPDGQRSIPVTKQQAQELALEGWKKYQAPAQEKPHEVNVQGDVDTFLGMKFPGYFTDKAKRTEALNAFANDPKLKTAYEEWWDKRKTTAPPIYNFVATDKGLVAGNARTGAMGQPNEGALKPIPASEITPLQQIKTLRSALETARNLYNPDFVGPVTGRAAEFGRSVLGGAGQSPERIVFNASLQQARNSLVYLLSGKQINETEYKRLDKQLPSSYLMPSAFIPSMDEFERTLDDILANKQQTLKEGGYGGGASPRPVENKKVSPPTAERKVIGDKSYIKQNGKWYEE
jgi:hypothetical protein